jgi:hypothetical protein
MNYKRIILKSPKKNKKTLQNNAKNPHKETKFTPNFSP